MKRQDSDILKKKWPLKSRAHMFYLVKKQSPSSEVQSAAAAAAAAAQPSSECDAHFNELFKVVVFTVIAIAIAAAAAVQD